MNRIKIKNFKSVQDQEINIPPLLALIGPNNAGKSNILKAINLVLGEKYPMPYSITKNDFYNENPANNIEIEIFFDTHFNSYDSECDAVRFTTSYNSSENSWDTELKARDSNTLNYQKSKLKGDVRDRLSIIYIPASRDFAKQLEGSSAWGLFGKIKNELNNLFPDEKKPELETKFDSIKTSLIEAEKFKKFEDIFKALFEEHILSGQHGVSLDIKPFDPKHYYKHLEIVPSEYGNLKNLDQLGDGTKNLILFALFRAYAEVFVASSEGANSIAFLVEEPEIYLHPQSRADLLSIFKSLAKKGSQVIYTTHSPELIDIENLTSIGVVRKILENSEYHTKITQINEARLVDKWKEFTGKTDVSAISIRLFLKNLSDAETNRGFFANKIVLVEGNSEKWALQEYAKKAVQWGTNMVDEVNEIVRNENQILNLEKGNIEIVKVTGKQNIDKFYTIYRDLGYPTYVIFDGDKKKNNGGETNERLGDVFGMKLIKFPPTTISSKFTIFEDDFEEESKKYIKDYDRLEWEARDMYGLRPNGGKPIVARYIASKIDTPEFIKNILNAIRNL